jgi:hypothetical protein
MNQLNDHNRKLIDFFNESLELLNSKQLDEILSLDFADKTLRGLLSIEEMRAIGSFFTGKDLSQKAITSFTRPITNKSIIIDPTCGTGNLLIECSRNLKVYSSLSATLTKWGAVLRGYDLYESFVDATKLRLIIEALSRGAEKDCSLEQALLKLPNIQLRDTMSVTAEDLSDVTHAIMNPPFSSWESPQINYWKKGKVNAAGVVLDHYIRNLPAKCNVSAILPDVLRSGSRYEHWRTFVSSMLQGSASIEGRFNQHTDVDVFILEGTLTKTNQNIRWFDCSIAKTVLSDLYNVCVGPLVAYRDPQTGPSYPYVHSKNTAPWETIDSFIESRKYAGRVIQPPFVVIRRTSSPTDKYRALASIITGSQSVAVENHLIVVRPKDNTLKSCKELLRLLKNTNINDFLNNRIRCRHLTVGVIKSIPIM